MSILGTKCSSLTLLGDLATVIETKENAVKTNQNRLFGWTGQDWRRRSDHSDLGRTKNYVFYGQSPYFLTFGQTSDSQVEVLLKWSDQSWDPSATLAGGQEQ